MVTLRVGNTSGGIPYVALFYFLTVCKIVIVGGSWARRNSVGRRKDQGCRGGKNMYIPFTGLVTKLGMFGNYYHSNLHGSSSSLPGVVVQFTQRLGENWGKTMIFPEIRRYSQMISVAPYNTFDSALLGSRIRYLFNWPTVMTNLSCSWLKQAQCRMWT